MNDDDLKIESLNYQDGKLDMSLSGEQGKLFMITLIQFFKDNGGENFLNLTINDKHNNKYAINIENCNGKFTSAEKLNMLGDEIKEIKEYINSEKEKIENSDDIPQWIYERLLMKIDKIESNNSQ